MNYNLAPERWETIPPDHIARMQISGDIRKGIVFVGYGTEDAPEFVGTGFILQCRGFSWLVTAGHVASDLGPDPFYIRADVGKPKDIDGAIWTHHTDRNVDVAVTPLAIKSRSGRVGYIPEDALLTREQRPSYEVDLGNFVYVLGLFRLLPGERRNFPVVHTGHIAALPGDEKFPVRLQGGARIEVVGYLVQVPSIPGLSGSPVFARRSRYLEKDDGGTTVAAGAVALMGIWVSAWPGKAAPEVQAARNATVPVGFGVVIPAEQIVETVEGHLRKHQEFIDKLRPAAEAQSSPPATDENPQHREDFNSLLDAAVRGKKSDDQT